MFGFSYISCLNKMRWRNRKQNESRGISEANNSLVDTTKWQTAAAGWGRPALGGRKKDEGDPLVIAGATWGPIQELGLILKWPERLQTQQASKQSWLHCGMSLPHWTAQFPNITFLPATARFADQQLQSYSWFVVSHVSLDGNGKRHDMLSGRIVCNLFDVMFTMSD